MTSEGNAAAVAVCRLVSTLTGVTIAGSLIRPAVRGPAGIPALHHNKIPPRNGAGRAIRPYTPKLRPMISFMISVVPP